MGDSKQPKISYSIGIRKTVNSTTHLNEETHSDLFCVVECFEQKHDLKVGQELWFKISDHNLHAICGVKYIGNVLSPEKELMIISINDGHRLIGTISEVKQRPQLPPQLIVLVEIL